MNTVFTSWYKWTDRNLINNIKFPGVYLIAYSRKDISNQTFSWLKEIIYVGMTVSVGGLRGRLNQFERNIYNEVGQHGGAQRVRYKYKDHDMLFSNLYLAVRTFECNVNEKKPEDLIVMGEIVDLEYKCLAIYKSKYDVLPEFNDMKKSPKK